jgi:hypothetical protein
MHCKPTVLPRRGLFWRYVGLVLPAIFGSGCTGSATTQDVTQTQANVAPVTQNEGKDNGIDALPPNPLVEQLREQASRGATYFPLHPPSSVAEADVTAMVNRWQNGQAPLQLPGEFGPGLSVFMLERKGDTFIASSGIPETNSKISTRGILVQISTEMAGGGGTVTRTILSGVVWTPRASAIGQLDLSGPGSVLISDFLGND